MSKQIRYARIGMVLATSLCTVALAKLPAPDDAAKAKAAEAAARAAWSEKVAAFQLCKAQDVAAAAYFARLQQTGAALPTPVATPACTEPGPYAAPTPPLEAAGAHSPPETATRPPSSRVPEAELRGGIKK